MSTTSPASASIIPTTVGDVQAQLAAALESEPEPAVAESTPAPSVAPATAPPASPELPPETPEGRIREAFTTGRPISPDDVLALPARYPCTPEEFQALCERVGQHNVAVNQRDYLRGEEAKLVAAVPEWKDTARGRREIAKLKELLRTDYHIPDEQIATAFTDSRAILVVRDALRARQRDQEAPTVGRRASRSVGGHVHGTAPGERLRGTPSAAAVIRTLLE